MANSVDHADEKAAKLAGASHVIESVRFQTGAVCHREGLQISSDSAHMRNDSVALGGIFTMSYYIRRA